MIRGMVIVLLIVIAALLIFEFGGSNAGAQATGSFAQVLQNQELILEKLNVMDKKLNFIKIRLR